MEIIHKELKCKLLVDEHFMRLVNEYYTSMCHMCKNRCDPSCVISIKIYSDLNVYKANLHKEILTYLQVEKNSKTDQALQLLVAEICEEKEDCNHRR